MDEFEKTPDDYYRININYVINVTDFLIAAVSHYNYNVQITSSYEINPYLNYVRINWKPALYIDTTPILQINFIIVCK